MKFSKPNELIGDISNVPLEAPKHDSEERKPDLSLIPYDLINEMLLPAYEEGLQEYFKESWRLGFPVLKMCAAILRHLFSFMFKHEDYDPVAKEKYGIKKHHLGAVMFGCISIYNSLKINPDRFDNRIRLPKEK